MTDRHTNYMLTLNCLSSLKNIVCRVTIDGNTNFMSLISFMEYSSSLDVRNLN